MEEKKNKPSDVVEKETFVASGGGAVPTVARAAATPGEGAGETTGEKPDGVPGDTPGSASSDTPGNEPTAENGAAPDPSEVPGNVPGDTPGRRRNRRRLLALLITAGGCLLVLAAVLIVNAVRDRRPPELDTVRDRAEALVLASREINEIFFGEGLPTYERIYVPSYKEGRYTYTYTHSYSGEEKEYTRHYSIFEDHEGRQILKYQYCLAAGADTDGDKLKDLYEYPDLQNGGFLTVEQVNDYRYSEIFFEEPAAYFYTGEMENGAGETVRYWLVALEGYTEPFYYSAEDDPDYDYVTEDCPYQSIIELKALAEGVYSSGYLSSVYESLFTGIVVSDRDSGTLLARYAEQGMEDGYIYLMKSNLTKPMNVKRIYDFSTVTMDRSNSSSSYVVLLVETYLEGDEANRLTVRVGLTLEAGQWMLDTPTF